MARRVSTTLGWIVILLVVGLLTLVLYPVVSPSSTSPGQPAAPQGTLAPSPLQTPGPTSPLATPGATAPNAYWL